ncbi:MAG: hypothetical protein KBA91_00095 [Candidatus Moranbacteria bacterium]|jgi:chromosome segregation ATPase|nr:hypothetical protein [Candidatus Moranbacteria bacterium]
MDETQTEEQRAQKTLGHRLQSELFALEGDRSREEHHRVDFEAEVKRLKTSIGHLQAEKESKEGALLASVRKLALLDDSISHLKKKMNAL